MSLVSIVILKWQYRSALIERLLNLVLLPSQLQGDIGEMCDQGHQEEKKNNRKMFIQILESLKFLARQGLALRGSKNDSESNFIQLCACTAQMIK